MAEAFLYQWFDILKNKFYIGYHKGSLDDGYICSSKTMLKELNIRPNDFSREIIAYGNTQDMYDLETKLLQEVNAAQNPNYYNLHNNDRKKFTKPTSEQIKKGVETRRRRGSYISKSIGIARSDRVKAKISATKIQRCYKGVKLTEEHKRNISISKLGHIVTEQTKEKIRQKHIGKKQTPESIAKMLETKRLRYQHDCE